MAQQGIDPEKVTKPIQLVAAWFATLVLLVSAFLAAGNTARHPAWLPILYGAAAVTAVPFFAWLVFRLQTRYRPQLQEDIFYSKYLVESEKLRGFKPANRPEGQSAAERTDPENLPEVRDKIYRDQRGLFLIHTWLPSERQGQVADVSIRLSEHGRRRGTALSDGQVDRVEYYLGQHFFDGQAVTKTNTDDGFRLDVSAYDTLLCVARIYFTDGQTADVARYLDFALPGSDRGKAR